MVAWMFAATPAEVMTRSPEPERASPAPSVSTSGVPLSSPKKAFRPLIDTVITCGAPVPVWVNVKLPSDALAGDHDRHCRCR